MILKPQQGNAFRVIFEDMIDEQGHLITQQIEDTNIDFVNKRITVSVRATIVSNTFIAIRIVSNSSAYPVIEILEPSKNEVLYSLFPEKARLLSHDLLFDYKNTGFLMHKLVWSFKQIRVH